MTTAPVTAVFDAEDNDVVLVGDFDFAFGLGVPGVYRIDLRARWPRYFSHMTLIGEPEYRTRARDEIVADYRRSFRGSEIFETADGTGLLGDLERGFDQTARAISKASPRLVVAEFGSGSKLVFDLAVTAVANRGRALGWSLLLVGSALTTKPSETEILGPVAVSLGPVECTPETGAAIGRALRGGVTSPAGIHEVIAGAPAEWVRAYENGER